MRKSNPPSRGASLRSHGRMSIARLRPAIQKIEYTPISLIGKGAFGSVFLAKSSDGRFVAVKKVLQDPNYRNREQEIMQQISNKNCVQMLTSFKSNGKSPQKFYLNIVMGYLPMNLEEFIAQYRNQKLYTPPLYTKLFAFQLFAGLHYLHSLGIMHRDLKPANVLVNPETGELKICDFGSAKRFSNHEKSIPYIASRFYRAPELNMGCQNYSSPIDIWSAGCIIVEMVNGGIPLFQGCNTIDQLHEIAEVIGKPTPVDMSSFQHEKKNFYENFDDSRISSLKQKLPSHVKDDLLDLLNSIFVYQPKKRPTAYQLMQHRYFDELFLTKIRMPSNNPFPTLVRKPKKRAANSSDGNRLIPLKGFMF